MSMTLRLSAEDEKVLAELAEREGISRQQAAIRAIHRANEQDRHEQQVKTLSQEARARYADLLDRLSK